MRGLLDKMNPELRPHLAAMAAVLAATLALVCWPQAVLHTGYRSELQILVGLRCPFCGMTRDFAAILHGGRPTQNPCSWFAACFVYVLYPAAVFTAWKWNQFEVFHSRTARTGVVLALAVMLVANNWR
jgi:hypothetical protein